MQSLITERYLSFWGFSRPPFALHPSENKGFLSSSAEEALARLEYALDRGYRVVLLEGAAGVGKSWLLFRVEKQWRKPGRIVARLSARDRTHDVLLGELARTLGLTGNVGSANRLWSEIVTELAATLLCHEMCLIAIDDLSRARENLGDLVVALAEVAAGGRSPTVLVAARPGEQTTLGSALNDWLDLKLTLEPWTSEEVARYLEQSLQEVGGDATGVFTPQAVQELAEVSQGIPRDVNRLAEWSLIAAAGASLRPIDHELVREVFEEFYRHVVAGDGEGPLPHPAESWLVR